jgi:hypothetical protein
MKINPKSQVGGEEEDASLRSLRSPRKHKRQESTDNPRETLDDLNETVSKQAAIPSSFSYKQ